MSTSARSASRWAGRRRGGNPYSRFIPKEELGRAGLEPETFVAPSNRAVPEGNGGVRKPTLAERAAAEVNPLGALELRRLNRNRPQASNSSPAQPQPAAASQRARPEPAAAQQAARPAPRRPVVGGVPGEEPEPAPQAEASAPSGPSVDELVNEARQVGYQDGYRNGLAALESYKQTQAAQMAVYMNDHVGALAGDFHKRLDSLEQQLAGRIAGVALELARQVVRAELHQNPEVVVDVSEQALSALLTSARQIVLRLNPEDFSPSQGQLSDVMEARGARLVADPAITRGGCLVESDIAVVDATVEAR